MYIFNTFHARIQKTFRGGGGGKLLCYQRGPRPIFGNITEFDKLKFSRGSDPLQLLDLRMLFETCYIETHHFVADTLTQGHAMI